MKTHEFTDVDNNDIDFDNLELAPLPDIRVEEEPALKVEDVKEEEAAEEPKDEGIPKELENEYLKIYDAVMFEDNYEREYKLGKKYSVVFGTRSADADVQVARQLDAMNFQTLSAYQTMASVLTMSHSLREFNGRDVSKLTYKDRYTELRGKSSHLIELLSRHLVDFDNIVREALAYGEENF